MADDDGAGAKHALLKTIETGDVDFASHALMQVFGLNARIDLAAPGVAFRYRFAAAKLGALILTKSDASNSCVTRAMGDMLEITIPLDGRHLYHCGSHQTELHAQKEAVVGGPYETFQLRAERGRSISVCMPARGLRERAERLTDRSLDATLFDRMAERLDLAAPAAGALSRAMKSTLAAVADIPSLGVGAFACSGYEELLFTLAVANLFPGIFGAPAQTQPDCGLAVIGRARDYIEAHAAEPLELSRLASELGVSMRAMQHNFRKYFRLSPSDFVLECRLENARKRLAGRAPPATVTHVAFDCGFTDLSHFSSRYREKFRESPSETLLRNKRRQVRPG